MNKIFKISAALVAALSVAAFSGCEILEQFLGHTHDLQYVAEKDATCVADGNIAYYHCTVCGENFSDKAANNQLETVVVPALGHEMKYMPEKAPTCAEEGNIGYYVCSRCDGTFADSEGKTAVSSEDITLGKTAHTYSPDIWEYDSRIHWNQCSECGEHLNGAAHAYDENNQCTVCGYTLGEDDVIVGNKEDISSADLSIHFIELGNKYTGDCTLIKVGDTEVLIDAGSRQSSAPEIKDYIDEYCTDGVLEYVIVTHSDQDHIAGMVGTSSGGKYNGILYSYEIGTVIRFDRTNKEETTAAGNPTLYGRFLTAVDAAEAAGAAVYTGLQCYNNQGGAQRTYYLDEEQTVSMNILYNYYYEHDSSDENNYSVCMLLTQQLEGGEQNNYLFTGDLEAEGEEYLVEYNELPEVELFKAGHHGSPTSSNEVLLRIIKPKNIVVCCCCGSDEYTDNNANQFPSQAFINRAAQYTENIFCTTIVSDNEDGFESMNGDIVLYFNKSEGEEEGSLKLWCSNNTVKLKDTAWFAANRTWPGFAQAE